MHRGFRVVADAEEEDRELVSGLGGRTVVPRGPGFGWADDAVAGDRPVRPARTPVAP